MNDPNLSSFIWSVADLLRGDYKQSEHGRVILPFTVLRRLDCVLERSKSAVLTELAAREKARLNPEPFLLRKSGQHFFNTSPLDIKKLMGDQDHIKENLTGISTYIWIVSNRKPTHRKGKLQLIDASGFWQKMRKSLGSKRKELSPEHIDEITRLFGESKEVRKDGVPISRIFKNEGFGYRTITVERPLRDAKGKIVLGTKGKLKGKPQPDANLRDTENVPLSEKIETYFKREVLPHAPDAWIDHEKTKVGYEIPFNRHFYVFKPPRDLAEIDAELKVVTDRILTMIGGLSK